MPEVPTMKAQGYDVVAASSTGMIAPAETPQNVVDRRPKSSRGNLAPTLPGSPSPCSR
jgi:tripartite-type tricarboxylate transporter receptor subunit TctC